MSGVRGRDPTQNVAPSPAANSSIERQLDEAEIKALIEFFTLLDSWERKSNATKKL
jgi:hypothetical protein